MKPNDIHSIGDVLSIITRDRVRTNILRKQEQKALAYLVKRIPARISSDMLSALGFFGSIVILTGFILAARLGDVYLLLGVLGFLINWFGDSLDGRLAYYRGKPRKWYGFSFDLTLDWIGEILMCLGFILYIEDPWKILGFCFIVLYGWEIISTLLRYKVTGKYSIDNGLFGPTEVRIIVSAILILEILFNGSIIYLGVISCSILLIFNIVNTYNLLKEAEIRDNQEREQNNHEQNG